MKENVLFPLVFAVSFLLLGTVQTVSAGVEPSPFQPEINTLHSIELNISAVGKRIGKLPDAPASPEGITNRLEQMANNLGDLDTRLEDVLSVLPMPLYDDPYEGQDKVLALLEGMRSDARRIYDVAARMGVEPTPFREAALEVQYNAWNIMSRILGYACAIGGVCPD